MKRILATAGCARLVFRFAALAIVALQWDATITPATAIVGLSQALDPAVTVGATFNIPGPPVPISGELPIDNSVEDGRALMESRMGPGSIYQSIRQNYLTVQHPNATLNQVSSLIQERYDDLIMSRVNAPPVTSIGVEHMTLIYPVNYFNNAAPVTVRARRLTLNSAGRQLVAYYLNYDKLDQHNGSVLFQSNGHFGNQPSRMGIGLKDRGGTTFGAALGKIAMQGYPLLTYDDHNVGESSNGVSNSLHRTLENMVQMDQTLLVNFDRVDGLGLSGGSERLHHFMMFFESNVKSAYFGGYFNPPWTQYDSVHGAGSPFGINPDTYDDLFNSNFLNADLGLVGIDRGVQSAFVHATVEWGPFKYGYFEEMLPAMRQYTNDFQTRGDDANGDGIPDYGKGLQHEYNLPDLFKWIDHVRTIPEPTTMTMPLGACGLILLMHRRRAGKPKLFR